MTPQGAVRCGPLRRPTYQEMCEALIIVAGEFELFGLEAGRDALAGLLEYLAFIELHCPAAGNEVR